MGEKDTLQCVYCGSILDTVQILKVGQIPHEVLYSCACGGVVAVELD